MGGRDLMRHAAGVQDAELLAAARAGLTFNTPLSEDRAGALIELLGDAGEILDLGCGRGELLLRALERRPDAVGTGVDLDEGEIAAARQGAHERGLESRAHFAIEDVTGVERGGDVAIAIGVAHAWDGLPGMLAALRSLAPRILIGDGFWAEPPSQAALQGLGAEPGELGSLDELLASVGALGFEVVDVQAASLDEWDAFESSWRAGLGDHPLAEERRRGYEEGYRGALGFAYVTAQVASS
jgi:SAM-dependent methyltransferase